MRIRQVFEFDVDGIPVAQGSMSAFVRGNHAIVTDQKAKVLKPWRQQVSAMAAAAYEGSQLEGAVVVALEFRLVRPRTVKRERPSVKPDVDKLSRSILDSLKDAGVIGDDSQVTKLVAEKVYAPTAGVHVRVGQYL